MFTLEQINAAIEAMAKSQHAAQRSIGKVIVMAAWAANANSDASVANSLMKNLRKGVKKAAVIAVLEHVANLACVSGSFTFFDAGKDYSEESAKAIKVAAASWEDFKPAPAADKAIDAATALDDLVQRLVKASAKGNLEHAAILVRIQQLNAEVKGELVFEVNTAD